MDDGQLLRYSRQILLPQIDASGQQRLLDARVIVFGVGGLGSPVAMYLAAAGVGQLTLVDPDQVDLSNLQRQIVHDGDSLGQNKVDSAARRLSRLNPDCQVQGIAHALDSAALDARIGAADLVLDCTDNFATRFAINAACVRQRRVLISAAAIGWQGQFAVFAAHQGSGCYQCLYPPGGAEDLRCSDNGVAAPLVGVLGSLQALEAVRIIGAGAAPATGRLRVLDSLHDDWRTLRLRPDPDCAICGQLQG